MARIGGVLSVCFLALGLAMIPGQAHAYIDPGSGSLIAQAIMAGLLGGVFTLKMYWRHVRKKIDTFLGRDKRDS